MLSLEQRACNAETHEHIHKVREYMNVFITDLMERALEHDRTKLESPEVELFTEMTPLLAGTKYPSPEYDECKRRLDPALQHHYARYRHHPEHFPCIDDEETKGLEKDIAELEHIKTVNDDLSKSEVELLERTIARLKIELAAKQSRLNGMNLLDLVEMFADWKAAGERQMGGNIRNSINTNTKKFGIASQLQHIFENTMEVLDG